MKGKSYDFFMTSKMVQLMAVLLIFFFIFICVVLCSIYFIVCIVKSEQKKKKGKNTSKLSRSATPISRVQLCSAKLCFESLFAIHAQKATQCNMQQHQLNRNALKHINARRELELKSRARPLTY